MQKFTPRKNSEENPDAWMLSYSDMVTLMLAFFVILLAISKIDPIKVEMLTQSVNQAMDRKKVKQISIEKLVNDVDSMIVRENLQDVVDVSVTSRGVAVSARGKILFSSGSTQLHSSGYSFLHNMSNIISETPYNIAVEGHTDNVPISGSLAKIFPSNWELSSARASAVVRYFIQQGIPAERFRAVGLADTKPVTSNETAEGRAKNRRVTIVFLVF